MDIEERFQSKHFPNEPYRQRVNYGTTDYGSEYHDVRSSEKVHHLR